MKTIMGRRLPLRYNLLLKKTSKTFIGRRPLLERDLFWKNISNRRRPQLKKDVHWKKTFIKRDVHLKNTSFWRRPQQKKTSIRKQPTIEWKMYSIKINAYATLMFNFMIHYFYSRIYKGKTALFYLYLSFFSRVKISKLFCCFRRVFCLLYGICV